MNQHKIKCLVIDDDLFIHDLMEDKLKSHFPEMEILAMASSGAKGLEIIKAHEPDLVFLDVEMSDMTGCISFFRLSRISDCITNQIPSTTHSQDS